MMTKDQAMTVLDALTILSRLVFSLADHVDHVPADLVQREAQRAVATLHGAYASALFGLGTAESSSKKQVKSRKPMTEAHKKAIRAGHERYKEALRIGAERAMSVEGYGEGEIASTRRAGPLVPDRRTEVKQ